MSTARSEALRSLVRAAICTARARGRPRDAVARDLWPDDHRLQLILRSPTAPNTSLDAAALSTISMALLDAIKPVTAVEQLIDQGIKLLFGHAGSISVPTFGFAPCDFVGEGNPIPVRQSNVTAPVLHPNKFASIIELTHEMVNGSNAETMVTRVLLESVGLGLARTVLSNSPAVPQLRPAGILHDATELMPAPTGPDAMQQDLVALSMTIRPYINKDKGFLIVADIGQASAIHFGLARELPMVVSSVVMPPRSVAAIASDLFVIALGVPRIEIVPQAMLLERDSSAEDCVANYHYATPQNPANPTAGQITHSRSVTTEMRISNIDADGVDHSTVFATLINGDTVSIDWATWTITAVALDATFATLTVTPAGQQVQVNIYPVTVHHVAPPIPSPQRSLWQTDTVAIKLLVELSFAMRLPNAVAWMQNVSWPPYSPVAAGT